MLKQSNNKFKKIFKGAAFGMACMLSVSGFPIASIVGSLGAMAETYTPQTTENVGSISLHGAKSTATKGVEYPITAAQFTKNGQTDDVTIDGTGTHNTSLKTDITVRYKNSDLVIDPQGGKFTPDLVGTYTITYTVTDESDHTTYSYDYDIVCEVGEVNFEFAQNDANILPTVYDKELFGTETPKDIALPMPKLTNAEDVKFYDESSKTGTEYVVISLAGGTAANAKELLAEALTVDSDHGTAKINGTKLLQAGEGTYTITYTYYQNSVPVSFTTKEFVVKNGYYKNSTAKDAGNTYDIAATLSTTPTSASTGVAFDLPTVKATTSSENAPANEAINVSFEVAVSRRDNTGKYVAITAEQGVVDKENNTFTAKEDGDYRFEYTITDFYGKHPKQSRVFYINGIKDDVKPTVVMYNAKDFATLETDEKTGETLYKSAKEDFKNETVNRNIVVYAIGVNDNAKAKGMTLTRDIRDPAGISRFTIIDKIEPGKTNVTYNDYNLVFNFDKEKFVEDNFAIKGQMSSEEQSNVENYLKTNRYLIVTHTYYQDAENKTKFDFTNLSEANKNTQNDPEAADFDEEKFKAALLELGYAYVPYVDGTEYRFSNQTYYVYYMAEDKAGNKKDNDYETFTVSTSDYSDTTAPSLDFTSSLKSIYLPTEKITFAQPNVSDTSDNNPKTMVYYRYLTTTKAAISVDGAVTLAQYANYDNRITTTGAGFVELVAGDDENYTIDIAERPEAAENAGYVELFIFSVDDYGNTGYYQKLMKISSTGDQIPVTLTAIKDAYDAVDTNTFVQKKDIKLPTLTYSDDFVDYMTHSIVVYYVDGENYREMPSKNSHGEGQEWLGTYTLDAGTFTASYAGKYRAVVTVKDAGNNSVATFFDYTVVESGSTVEDPTIDAGDVVVDNLKSETISLDVDQEYTLVPPTLTIDDNGVGYAGYEENDDSKTALYYTVSTSVAENNNYSLTKYHFVGNVGGTYDVVYSTYLVKYTKGDNAKIVDGCLAYEKDGQTYSVVPDMVSGELVILDQSKTNQTAAHKNDPEYIALNAELVELPKITLTFTVTDDQAPVWHDVDRTQYYNRTKVTDGEKVEIQRIQGSDNSLKGIDPTESNVVVRKVRPNGTSDSRTIKMSEWLNNRSENDWVVVEGNKLMLCLSEDAEYSLTYTVSDYSGKKTSNSDNPISFKVGDMQKPTLEIQDGFIKKKKLEYKREGQTVNLDATKLILGDNTLDNAATDEDKQKIKDLLLKNVTITVSNEAGAVEVVKDSDELYHFEVTTSGTYTITVTTTDGVGNKSIERTEKIEVTSKSSDATKISVQTIGTILIVASVVILLGVITYFIYSKIKLDKELKGTGKKKKNKK